MKLLFSIFLYVLVFSTTAAQGKIDGFYNIKGSSTLVLGGGFEDSKTYLAGNAEVDLMRKTYYISLYGVYGITDNLDVNVLAT